MLASQIFAEPAAKPRRRKPKPAIKAKARIIARKITAKAALAKPRKRKLRPAMKAKARTIARKITAKSALSKTRRRKPTPAMKTKPPTLARADLEAGRLDLGANDGTLPPMHAGEVLRHEFLEPLGLSAHALALALRVPANRIAGIVAGNRAVSAETALRLARHFGTSAGFWLNLQKGYELECARRNAGARIAAEVAPRAAA
jgi:addiction module HigA family antidote